MSQLTDLDTSAIAARYLAVFNESDAIARRAAIEDIWLPDATEYVFEVKFQGYEELEARVIRAYQTFVATGKYTVEGADDVTCHGDLVMFTAHLVTQEGVVDWSTRVFMLLDPGGRIKEDYQLTVKPFPA